MMRSIAHKKGAACGGGAVCDLADNASQAATAAVPEQIPSIATCGGAMDRIDTKNTTEIIQL
jgi:hypothetical protein